MTTWEDTVVTSILQIRDESLETEKFAPDYTF
jgi:hypothetical protein